MRIFLAGGTGQIGRRLIPRLLGRGDTVVALTRNAAGSREALKPESESRGLEFVEGDPMQTGAWQERVAGCEGVINLVGEGIFNRRWSEEFKQLLQDSRVRSTMNVVSAIQAHGLPTVRLLVNASAIGYYGPRGDEELDEESPAGDDFLARTCVDWEEAAKGVEGLGVRLVRLRTGVVLDKAGGALKQMLTPFKMFVGGKVGSGRQWVSWIHHEDEVGMILLALDNEACRGPLNSTAPNPVTNKELAKAIGSAPWRPSVLPTPGFMLGLALGEVAEVVTKGQRVLPKKALGLGYEFKYPEIGGR